MPPPQGFRRLTRRALLSSTSLLRHSRCCPLRPPLRPPLLATGPSVPRMPPPRAIAVQQCREMSLASLFGGGAKKKPLRPATPPGMDTLKALARHLDRKIGAEPSREALAQACADMVHYCRGAGMRDDHAALLLRAYRHMRSVDAAASTTTTAMTAAATSTTNTTGRGQTGIMPRPMLVHALQVLRGGQDHQMALARMIWDDLHAPSAAASAVASAGENMALSMTAAAPKNCGTPAGDGEEDAAFFYVTALCQAGRPAEAAAVCRALPPRSMKTWRCWDKVLAGFARLGDGEGLLATMEHLLRKPSPSPPQSLYYHPVAFFCARNDLDSAAAWFERAMQHCPGSSGNVLPVYVAVLQACARTRRFDWGNQIVAKMEAMADATAAAATDQQNLMGPREWDAVLQFALAKGLEQGRQAMDAIMARGAACLNVDTFNSFISVAVAQARWEHVDGLVAIMRQLAIEPDYRTLELRIRQQLGLGDLLAALELFRSLKFTQELPADGYPGEVPQQLLQALTAAAAAQPRAAPASVAAAAPQDANPTATATAPQPDSSPTAASTAVVTREMVITLYNDLIDLKIFLSADTCLALFSFLLHHHNRHPASFQNARTLLNRHVGHYSSSQRHRFIACILNFARAPAVSNEDAWQAYLLLMRTLPDTGLQYRQRLMENFFARQMPHAATRVLEHMAASDDHRPNRFQYTCAFSGIARSGDIESLLRVQQQLAMDPFVEADTMLLNSMMNAYARCGAPDRALDIYDRIMQSPQGPDHATISQVFDVCGRLVARPAQHPRAAAAAADRARRIWDYFTRKRRVPLTENNVSSFVEALARLGDWDAAWKTVRDMPLTLGIQPGPRV